MITIRVMLVGGVLVGYTVSDRWNLMTLTGRTGIRPEDLKTLRATAKLEDIKINTIKRAKPAWKATPLEMAALGETAPIYGSSSAVA
jgi:hypothetical protein